MRIFNKIMGSIGGILIGLMMLLILAEVLSRLFFGSSIEGTLEIVGIFLALAVFFGFAPCEENNGHVRVDLIVQFLPQRVTFYLDIFVFLIAIAIVAVTAWQVGLDALSSWKFKEVLPGANVRVPVYPAKTCAFIGYFAFYVQLVINLITKIRNKVT